MTDDGIVRLWLIDNEELRLLHNHIIPYPQDDQKINQSFHLDRLISEIVDRSYWAQQTFIQIYFLESVVEEHLNYASIIYEYYVYQEIIDKERNNNGVVTIILYDFFFMCGEVYLPILMVSWSLGRGINGRDTH